MRSCWVLALLWQVSGTADRSLPVTKIFHRPPKAEPLMHTEALRRLAGLDRTPRRLQLSDAFEEFHEAWNFDASDPVQQVHVAPGRPGEAVVTWLTKHRGASSVVRYAQEGGYTYMVAEGQAKVYTTQICLPNSAVMTHPLLGPPERPFDFDDLTSLLNTSSFLPADSDSYRYVSSEEDPWEVVAKTNFCVDYKNPLAYYTSPYVHTVTLSGLKGRTKYVVRPEESNRSFTFKTPPDAGAKSSEPFRIGVWADVGITNISFNVMEEMRRFDPELLLTVGDLSYADGWAYRWDVFGTMMEPLMSTRYHLAVVGNHEVTQNNGVDFLYRYPMPSSESESESPFAFSYSAGPVHVIGTQGSYAGTDRMSVQWNFVSEKLQQVDREQTPWIVVMFHTPWYSSNKCHYGEGMKHQWDMEELLYQHGVDIVFNGHVHSYERSFPVFKNSRNECGITHIVVGDGGNYEGPAVYEGDPPGWKEPQPDWSAFREAAYGPGLLTVHNSTHAEWQWRRVACVSTNKEAKAEAASKKFTYDGSRQSLKRTRPLTRYVWDGISGPEGSPKCATDGDNSGQRFETSDMVTIVRDQLRCPNRAAGAQKALRKVRATPSSLTSLASSGLTTKGHRFAVAAAVALTASALLAATISLHRRRASAPREGLQWLLHN